MSTSRWPELKWRNRTDPFWGRYCKLSARCCIIEDVARHPFSIARTEGENNYDKIRAERAHF